MVQPTTPTPDQLAGSTPLERLHLIAVPTPWPIGDVNVYLAEGDPLTLIDTGPKSDEASAALTAGLDELGYKMSDIERIIVTHAHTDHYGLAGEIVAASGAEIWTHPYNVSRLSEPEETRVEAREFFGALWAEGGYLKK